MTTMYERDNIDVAIYFDPLANALAVALMIASEVIVALLVVSTPLTLCFEMMRCGVSEIAE